MCCYMFLSDESLLHFTYDIVFIRTYVCSYLAKTEICTSELFENWCEVYRMAQNTDGENIDKFDEFPAIRQ